MKRSVGTTAGIGCVGVAFALLVLSTATATAAKPITGKLSKAGYDVLALAHDGTTKSAKARPRFKIRAPGKRVTLHLRARNGTYSGPIVVGRARHGKRAIEGVVAGARLGLVEVKPAKGYAKLKRPLAVKWREESLYGRAKHGIPIGAGKFGHVRSRHTRGGVRDDRDIDGVPNPLDVDDDGDLVLDNSEGSRSRRGARAAQGDAPEFPGAPLYLRAFLDQIPLENTVNANAADITLDQIDATLSASGRVALGIALGQDSAELDCGGQPDPNDPNGWLGGLTYCTRGGSGVQTWPESFSDDPKPFPGPPGGQLDPDGDGDGTVIREFQLHHHAATKDPTLDPDIPQPGKIGTGDVLIERVVKGGQESEFSGTLQTVLATTPALVSYSDTAGHSARVSYPVAAPGPGTPGGPGTEGNGFPVAGGACPANAPPACVDGDIVLTLTFWRPQRRPIPPETAPWMDVGGLNYADAFGCLVNGADTGCGNAYCPRDAYSVPAGSGLTVVPTPDSWGALKDSAPDRSADPNNAFTHIVDLSECLRDPRGFGAPNHLTWDVGRESQLVFHATNFLDDSEQTPFLKRVG